MALINLAGGPNQVITTSGATSVGALPNTNYTYLIAGAHVPTLPTAVGNVNGYTFVNQHTLPVAFTTTSSQTVDGHASTVFKIYPSETVVLRSDGANWISNVKGTWRTINKLVGETKASTTVVTTDAVLFFPMLNGKSYRFDLSIILWAATATPDFKYSLTGPTTVASIDFIVATITSLGGTPAFTGSVSTALPTNVAILNNGAVGGLRIEGGFQPTATGSFDFQWAQSTSDPALTYVLSNSYFRFAEF